HYSIQQEIAWQNRELVPRRYRLTVTERLTPPDGGVLEPLDEAGVKRAAETFRAAGVEAVAVCFLFSYLNPEHELRARALLEAELPGVFITTSAEVAPQFREFERFTTGAMNAYIGPRVRDYVDRLAAGMRTAGISAELLIMRSNGGVATPRQIASHPVETLLSGPAAGVLGGAWAGASAGRENVITFDIGGTSADIGVVSGGRFSEAAARDTRIAGFPLLVSMLDIHTIGTGGGSIAALDAAGGFKVGPESAGAVPGPAAYGRGGDAPTLTDANLVLGRLDPDNFLGGEMTLDAAAARAAIDTLAGVMNMDAQHTAEGIVAVANSDMANAIKARTVQKGIDPRDYALVAFGGGGPLQAAEVAHLVGIPEVIIPLYPGINSALGLLTTDIAYDAIRTQFQVSTALDLERLTDAFDSMQAQLDKQFADDSIAGPDIRYARAADLRYVGQGYELRIDFPPGPVIDATLARMFEEFHTRHEAEYGHAFPDSPIEIVNVRLSGIGAVPKLAALPTPGGGALADALLKTDTTLFRVDNQLSEQNTAFYVRDALPAGATFDGPAVILQTDSTTLVPPGWRCGVDPAGNLLLTMA
ncbi:MAG: hydantoinase/oxoprolinase family protein, partial [Gammaproteobacteria bacterium]|nr:hydantoinase/oxoprolinase family protein [Gammaproteobacteria bacterium]